MTLTGVFPSKKGLFVSGGGDEASPPLLLPAAATSSGGGGALTFFVDSFFWFGRSGPFGLIPLILSLSRSIRESDYRWRPEKVGGVTR